VPLRPRSSCVTCTDHEWRNTKRARAHRVGKDFYGHPILRPRGNARILLIAASRFPAIGVQSIPYCKSLLYRFFFPPIKRAS